MESSADIPSLIAPPIPPTPASHLPGESLPDTGAEAVSWILLARILRNVQLPVLGHSQHVVVVDTLVYLDLYKNFRNTHRVAGHLEIILIVDKMTWSTFLFRKKNILSV